MAESGVRVVDAPRGALVVLPGTTAMTPEQARVLADRLIEAARWAERQREACV